MVHIGLEEILRAFCLSRKTFQEWLDAGFPAVKISGRWRLVQDDAERWISEIAAGDVARRMIEAAKVVENGPHGLHGPRYGQRDEKETQGLYKGESP